MEKRAHSSGLGGRTQGDEVMDVGRRNILKVLAGTPTLGLISIAPLLDLQATTAEPARSTSPEKTGASAYRLKVLAAHEWTTLCVLCDWIIPADERSVSASRAGVPEFIDSWIALNSDDLLAPIRAGLTWLDVECNQQFNGSFIDGREAQQKAMLDRIAWPGQTLPEDAAGERFFDQLRELVLNAFFATEAGLKDIRYMGNQALSEWKGCPADVLQQLDLN